MGGIAATVVEVSARVAWNHEDWTVRKMLEDYRPNRWAGCQLSRSWARSYSGRRGAVPWTCWSMCSSVSFLEPPCR